MMLWHMGPRQSLSEVVGTHVGSACKWIVTVFTHNTAPLPPPQSMLLQPKLIKPDEKWDTTLSRGRGDLSFVEIQRFCGICPNTFETDCSLLAAPTRKFETETVFQSFDRNFGLRVGVVVTSPLVPGRIVFD